MVVYTHKSLPLWGRWQPVRVVLSAADSKSVDCRGQSHLYSTDEVQYNVTKSIHFRRTRTIYCLRQCDFVPKSPSSDLASQGHLPQRGRHCYPYLHRKQPFSGLADKRKGAVPSGTAPECIILWGSVWLETGSLPCPAMCPAFPAGDGYGADQTAASAASP